GAKHIVGENMLLAARHCRELRRAMVDAADAPGGGDERLSIAQVAKYRLDVKFIDAGIVAVPSEENAHGIALREEPPQKIGAEMAGGPGEEDHAQDPITDAGSISIESAP